jgi:hypothetical protein
MTDIITCDKGHYNNLNEGKTNKSRTIILRIEPTLYSWLAGQADSNQMTVSALVRFILHQEAKKGAQDERQDVSYSPAELADYVSYKSAEPVGSKLRGEHRSHDL